MERKKKHGSLLICMGMAIVAVLWHAWPASAIDGQAWPQTLRSQMARLTDVGYKIGVVAAPLCPSTAAGTGIAIDYIEAYESADRAAVAALLNMTEAPQIAAVARGSPAEVAGVMPGDDLLAIDGIDTGQLQAASVDASLFADALEQRLAGTAEGEEVSLLLRRDGKNFQVKLAPKRVCGARFVLKTGFGITAFSDGRDVAVSSKLISFTRNDDELALIVAHEVGHVINRDGKAGSLSDRRRMEDRADALGATLTRCVGYDLEKGVQFWVRRDAGDWLRNLRDPTHRSRKSRVELMRKEAQVVNCSPSALGAKPSLIPSLAQVGWLD